MRMMRLALAASVAVVIGSGSAYAITVKKRIEAPGLPADVWVVAGETFCTIKTWHPAVAACEETKEGDVTFRTLTLKDGGKIKEKLTGTEDLAYSYEIIESPLPVKNYSSKLWVEADDEEDRSVIYWQSEFERRRWDQRRRGKEGDDRNPRRRRQGHQEERPRRLGQEASRRRAGRR